MLTQAVVTWKKNQLILTGLIRQDPDLFPYFWGGGDGMVGAGFLSLALLLASSPRFAHGGSLAALIDETFSKTACLSGEGLLTLNFNIRFKK